MRRLQSAPLLFVLLLSFAAAPASRPAYVTPDQFDLKAILGDPPADSSPEHKAEVDRILDLQAHRTPDEVRRCQSEEEVTAFAFADVLGDWFNEKNLPITAALMKDANADASAVSGKAKKLWHRVRPPFAEPRIKPCVVLEHTASYPSGHATRGILWAELLSQIFPDKREGLMARGKQIGDDRFLAGMHYPSDVAAGQKLGDAIAKKLLENSAFKDRLEQAKEECKAHEPK